MCRAEEVALAAGAGDPDAVDVLGVDLAVQVYFERGVDRPQTVDPGEGVGRVGLGDRLELDLGRPRRPTW